ncbi:hypothetical protein L9F63_009959, partial [Diploptera punctata]
VHLLREKLELCNKDGAHATVVHLEIHRDMLIRHALAGRQQQQSRRMHQHTSKE